MTTKGEKEWVSGSKTTPNEALGFFDFVVGIEVVTKLRTSLSGPPQEVPSGFATDRRVGALTELERVRERTAAALLQSTQTAPFVPESQPACRCTDGQGLHADKRSQKALHRCLWRWR